MTWLLDDSDGEEEEMASGLGDLSVGMSSLPMRELAWRRVADDSHDLWCCCMDWKAHVEYAHPASELRPGSGGWPEHAEAQWRQQVHAAHDVWCNCGDWQGHALRSRSRTAESGRSSSSSSVSVLSDGDQQPWWKRLRVKRPKFPSWARRWTQRHDSEERASQQAENDSTS